jgi:hypothetical protein
LRSNAAATSCTLSQSVSDSWSPETRAFGARSTKDKVATRIHYCSRGGDGTREQAKEGALGLQKIVPHLWFDKEAKEAAAFYTSLFKDSKVNSVSTITDTPSGDCDIVSFTLSGQDFMSISAGPIFNFTIDFVLHDLRR